MKLGMQKDFQVGLIQGSIKVSMHYQTAVGLLFYIVSFGLYTLVVSKFNLSYIAPIVMGTVAVLTLIFSFAILKESISVTNWLGAALVIAGIVVMNIRKEIH